MFYFFICGLLFLFASLRSALNLPEGYSPALPVSALLLSLFKLTSGAHSTFMFAYGFAAKLTLVWFFTVWLRLNLMRLRFDQVASYTWHELVLYGICVLLEIVVAVWLL